MEICVNVDNALARRLREEWDATGAAEGINVALASPG